MPHGYVIPARMGVLYLHIGVGSALLVRLVGLLIPLYSGKQGQELHAFSVSMYHPPASEFCGQKSCTRHGVGNLL